MKKLICGLGMIGILYVSPSYAQTCSAQPDCATLGYTQVASDCKDKMVKCPFDTSKVACIGGCTDYGFLYTCTGTGYAGGVGTACDNKYSACNCSSVYTWNGSGCSCKSTYAYTCTGTYQTGGAGTTCDGKYTACNCSSGYEWNGSACSKMLTVGEILFSDKTTSANLVSGKTAIGVVFDATNRYAVALTESSSYMTWSTTYTDIPGLKDCTYYTVTTTCGTNGKSNTQMIIAQGASYYPAASYCNSYSTTGTSAGDWWLPSGKELYTIYTNKTAINTGLTKAGGMTLTESWYWSSTEDYTTSAWGLGMSNGDQGNNSKYNSTYVRPVTSF